MYYTHSTVSQVHTYVRTCVLCCTVDQHLTVKLTDFSLVQKLSENGQYRMKDGGTLPVRWMSPESLVYGIYTVHTDCWYVHMYLGSNFVRLLYRLFNYMSNVMMILVL